MAEIFTEENLAMLFEELFEDTGISMAEWINSSHYDADSWTDKQIWEALPPEIKAEVSDLVANFSWGHGGF